MKFLKLFALLICINSFAQDVPTTKVGTVDVDYILSLMPELADVQKQADAYAGTLKSQLDEKMIAYQAYVDASTAAVETMTIKQKETTRDSITALEVDINQFQQNAQKLAALKQEEFLQPLYEKIGNSLQKVAEAEGYTQVLLRDNRVVFIDNRLDLTLAILADLGIEVPQEGDGN